MTMYESAYNRRISYGKHFAILGVDIGSSIEEITIQKMMKRLVEYVPLHCRAYSIKILWERLCNSNMKSVTLYTLSLIHKRNTECCDFIRLKGTG